MPKLHLSDRTIASLKVPGIYWDDTTPAFGVRIGAATKTFLIVHNNGRRHKLGQYPALSLQEARKRAKRLLLEPDTPKTARTTLAEALATYILQYVRANYRPRSAYNTERLLARIEGLGPRSLTELKPADITAILDTLTPAQANHLFGALRTFFNWCERRDLVPASPLKKLTKPHKEKGRSRTLSDDELVAIWRACRDDSFGNIVKLLMLTGQRRGEIAALERSWIEKGVITFPADITKNGEQHTIPLASLSAELVRSQLAQSTTLLFPSRKTGTVITGWGNLKQALDVSCGVTDWTLHDLRRTFSTKLAELGTAPHIIEQCLNHQTGTLSPLARRYNQYRYFEEMRTAFAAYDGRIARLISP